MEGILALIGILTVIGISIWIVVYLINDLRGYYKNRKDRVEIISEKTEIKPIHKDVIEAPDIRKTGNEPSPILGYTGQDNRIHTTNPEGKNILIPEHLSEEEKDILREFYDLY